MSKFLEAAQEAVTIADAGDGQVVDMLEGSMLGRIGAGGALAIRLDGHSGRAYLLGA